MRSFLLFFALAQSAWQADCQNLWGEPEVIGVSAEERKIVLEVLGIQVDEVAPVLTELGGMVNDKCKRVKGVASDWDKSEISCTIVQFPTGRIHFVVDVFDRNQISEYRNIQDGIDIDLNSNSDRKLTLNCALYCDKADSRASAFKELSNLPMDAATCIAAMAGLNDVRAVRNYATQLLNMSYSECKGHIGITTMFDHLIPLLRYPSHTDRNKSMATIDRIIQDPGFDGSCHWEEGVVSIRRLAEESVLPNVGGIARRIVRYIDENHITRRRLDCGGSSNPDFREF